MPRPDLSPSEIILDLGISVAFSFAISLVILHFARWLLRKHKAWKDSRK